MFNLEPESSSPVLGSPDPMKAGINGMEDETRSLSNLEFGAESALDIEKLMPAVEEDLDLLLASDGLGAASVDKPPEVGKDLLTGDTDDATTGEVDTLTGGSSDRSKIETRARQRDFAGNSRGKAYNVGELTETETFGDVVGKSDRRDLYKFRVKEKTDVAIALDELDGNANLFLLNNKGKVLEKSVNGGKQGEEISMELEPGVYYGEVRAKGSATANYEITFDGDGAEALPKGGLQVRSSRRRWDIFPTVTLSDNDSYDKRGSVNIGRPDLHRFTVKKSTEVEIELSGLDDNADLYLYNKKGKLLIRSRNSGSRNETINVDLKRGTYQVGVQTKDRWSNIDYDLEINAGPRTRNTGILTGTESFSGNVSRFDRYDFYKFSLDESKEVDISLSGLSDNADLYLAKPSGKKLKTITKSKSSGSSDEAVSYPLGKGDYYVVVKAATKSDNTEYDLVISEQPLQSAGVLTDTETFSGSVDKRDPYDFYFFKLEEKTDVNINLSGLNDNADLHLFKNTLKKKGFVKSSKESGRSNESINENLSAGTYVAVVQSKGGADTDYRLSLEPKVTTRTDSSPGIPYSFGQLGTQDDSLWEIAQRELKNGNRWNEIMKEDGSTYTDEEAGRIKAGTIVYLPKDGNSPDGDDSSSGNGGSDGSGNTGNSYYSELSSLKDSKWDEQSGDNNRFDPQWYDRSVDNTKLTLPAVSEVYTDLSKAILGDRYPMTSGYAFDQSYYDGVFFNGSTGYWHAGLDIGVGRDTPVKTVVGGTTQLIQDISGNYFMGVEGDDGKLWIYGHLRSLNVSPGVVVNAGETIGLSGPTKESGFDPHLHLEVQPGKTYARTGGANKNQDFVLESTISPLQAYWELRNR